ncbi:hypothetical protein CKM354_000559800 [Cercospora kikuchii]|uniref:FHA domain-containing protein n=1 Tax=Cercospora kikuchii TaxID=84275 RepID=A0A9P3CGH5_9PEZI|nr:uncharacterized protein CKM354_000559800 [Cercospora kikuchii]GIZ42323.1 hypothetical protein CKM354_000559800 [Cercospora kikuchii]
MPPYLTCIALSSTTGDDHRSIDLIPDKPCVIGRTSKSKADMEARTNNALFDCAVVSRQHAEIRVAPWATPGTQITLTDLNSLHGTAVNGRRLTPLTEFALKSGDVIKFGERVSRGEEAHDGVSVTFRHLKQHDSHPEGSRHPISSRGARVFEAPDLSDQSDFDSDIEFDIDSVGSCVEQTQSAETTPEQPKMGTQSQPIDLDEVKIAHSKVISLVDEEDLDFDENQGAPFKPASAPQRTTVPESINLVDHQPKNPAEAAPAAAPAPPTFFNLHESDFDDVHEDVVTYNTGLSKILNERELDDEQVIDEDDQGEEAADAEYVGHATEQESDLDSLDGSPALSEAEMDDYEPAYISQRQPSEELGQPNAQAVNPVWQTMREENALASAAAPKPHYDPVRGSRLATEETSAATALPEPSKYTYDPWYPGFLNSNLATDNTGSRRWDIPPVQSQNSMFAPLMPLPSSGPYQAASSAIHNEKESHRQQSEPQVPIAAQASRGKLAIGDLLQPHNQHTTYRLPQTMLQESVGSHVMPQLPALFPAVDASAATVPEATSKPAGKNKRKASAVFDTEVEHSEEPAAKKVVTVDAATGTQRAIAAQADTKSNTVQRIVSAAVKHAVSAGVGVAATIAFLNSTYAERVIEYLS